MPIKSLNARRKAVVGTFVWVGLIIPVVIMSSCSGWNAGSMQVSSCLVGATWYTNTADALYGFVYVSAFILFIPVIIYMGLLAAIGSLLARVILREPISKG
jgi:hypothetical protein